MTRKIISTPIKHKPISDHKKKSGKPCSHTDFDEQKKRNEFILDGNEFWCWDDDKKNKGRIGDVFIFWEYNGVGKGGRGNPWGGGNFIFHEVVSVLVPSGRLTSWRNNVGQGSRNVLTLSPPKLTLTYDEITDYGARLDYHRTTYPKKGFHEGSRLMRLIEQNF